MKHLEVSPEQNLRFMNGLASEAQFEIARHQRERVAKMEHVPLEELEGMAIDESTERLRAMGFVWNPDDILTPGVVARMHEEAMETPLAKHPAVLDDKRKKLGPHVMAGNIKVENGHPGYSIEIYNVFSPHPDFWMWGKGWIGDEYIHGPAIQQWGKFAGYLDMVSLHKDTQGYQRNGLTLKFPTTAHGLAYPALQEPATVMTHREAMRLLPTGRESYSAAIGRNILGHVIADERAHEIFYANMVRHALESGDPEIVSMQMLALADAVMGFAMPGMESDIPNRVRMMAAYKRTGAFTLQNLATKILQPAIEGEGTYGWDVANKTELNDDAKKAQEDLVAFGEEIKHADGDAEVIEMAIFKAREEYGVAA